MSLGRDEVEDLSDGLLVRVVTEHHALQRVPRHLAADPIDDALGVGLVHGDHLHFGGVGDVHKVLFLKPRPQGDFTGVAHQDDGDAERVDEFGIDWGKSRRTGRVLGGDDNTSLVATSPLATLSPRGPSRSWTWTSTPARLADGQEDDSEEEQREEEGGEGRRVEMEGRVSWRWSRGAVGGGGGGGGGEKTLVLKTGGRDVEADEHRGGV